MLNFRNVMFAFCLLLFLATAGAGTYLFIHVSDIADQIGIVKMELDALDSETEMAVAQFKSAEDEQRRNRENFTAQQAVEASILVQNLSRAAEEATELRNQQAEFLQVKQAELSRKQLWFVPLIGLFLIVGFGMYFFRPQRYTPPSRF